MRQAQPWLYGRLLAVLVGLTSGCAALPDVQFDESDGGPPQGPSIDATTPSLSDAEGLDAGATRDAAGPPMQPLDAHAPSPEAAAPPEAGGPPPMDAGELVDAHACLPKNAPEDAGCCYAVLPCVGQGCDYCSLCIAKACHTNQFCCAQYNPQGAFQGVQCSGDGKNCP